MITLDDLRGHWRLEREIEDLSAGLTGQLSGAAVWRDDEAGLIHEESGLLEFGDAAPMQAERRYLWRQDGDDLAVFFEDGRPFHRIGPGRLRDRHDCPPDIYDVTYAFGETGAFSTTWRIIGPRKDLMTRSHYTPMR
jgi:hypothetical protein